MAKSKRSRPGRPPSGSQASRPAAAPATRVAPAEPGGPNRIARKEEARRQREALQRRMARRRWLRIGGLVLAVLVLAGGVTAYALTRPAPTAAAGCSPVKSVSVYPKGEDRSHIGAQGATGSTVVSPPPLSSYPSTPPASGPHDSSPLDAGVYTSPPDVYRTIHSMEHGGVIVWYRPGTSSDALRTIQDFYRSSANNDHVIVAPYSYPTQGAAGALPEGTDLAMTAWHRMQACATPSLAAVQEFVKLYRTPTGQPSPSGYKGEAPEAGAVI